MMDWDGHGGGGWAVGMAIFMILFWGSIVTLLAVGVRALLNRPPQPGQAYRQELRDILTERLARAEIEPEGFQYRFELLAGKRSARSHAVSSTLSVYKPRGMTRYGQRKPRTKLAPGRRE